MHSDVLNNTPSSQPTHTSLDMSPPTNFNATTTAEEAAQYYSDQIRGKTILVTGVTPGSLGAYFAEAVAKHQPQLIVLAARDAAKAETITQAIAASSPNVKIRTLMLDLSSQDQVRAAAKEVNAYEEAIDVVVNSAGIMACPYGTSKDGVEMHFATNHIGHFLFTNLIMDKILASPSGGRVISVSSAAHRFSPVRFEDVGYSVCVPFCISVFLLTSSQNGKTYRAFGAYGQSKTANILFAVALAQRLKGKGLVAFSLHPGVIMTNLVRHLDLSKGPGEAMREARKCIRAKPCNLLVY
jgi:NAD(P)-dependent dehydrogenase (short-subunit alcohol dehydrogenase family)